MDEIWRRLNEEKNPQRREIVSGDREGARYGVFGGHSLYTILIFALQDNVDGLLVRFTTVMRHTVISQPNEAAALN